MPGAFLLTLSVPVLPSPPQMHEMAWPSEDTVLCSGPGEQVIEHPDGGDRLVVPRATLGALRQPTMPRLLYAPARADGWDIYILGGPAYGRVVGWWHHDTTPVPPQGGTVGPALVGAHPFAALRPFAAVSPGR